MRSEVHKFGDRCRDRFTIKSWCLRIRDSATMERTPPGPSKRARVAMKWINRMITFVTDSKGRATELILHQGGVAGELLFCPYFLGIFLPATILPLGIWSFCLSISLLSLPAF